MKKDLILMSTFGTNRNILKGFIECFQVHYFELPAASVREMSLNELLGFVNG